MNHEREEQERIAVRNLARSLVDVSFSNGDHRMALEALLLAFSSVAAAHPCCTDSAADAALRTVTLLRDRTTTGNVH
jgi:hypothetical protein